MGTKLRQAMAHGQQVKVGIGAWAPS